MTTTADRARIVLAHDADVNELASISADRWWASRLIKREDDTPSEAIFVTDDSSTAIHWIHDHRLGVKYILVAGPAISEVIEVIKENLSYSPSPAIMKRAHKTDLPPADRRVAVYYLAIDKMEHGFDQETFDIYSNALRDPDSIVRGAAIVGSSYLAWPQLADPIRPLSTSSEPDESIRQQAATLVERLSDRK